MEESLMDATLRLLRDNPKTLPTVYAELHELGSHITFSWLRKFSAGHIKDPSVNRIEELYRYLTDGKPASEHVA